MVSGGVCLRPPSLSTRSLRSGFALRAPVGDSAAGPEALGWVCPAAPEQLPGRWEGVPGLPGLIATQAAGGVAVTGGLSAQRLTAAPADATRELESAARNPRPLGTRG
jgi:hypothetical protein